MGGVVSWLKALSIKGKFGLAIASLFVFGAVVPEPAQKSANTVDPTPTVEQQDFEEQVQQAVVEVETETEEETIPFETETRKTNSLNKGTTQVQTQGVNGVRTLTYEVTYEDGIEVKRELVSSKVTKKPVNKIVLSGTYVAPKPQPQPQQSNCEPGYSPCVPRVSYDLDCADIGFTVRVTGSDPHRFDGDNDGWGCESY